MIIASVDPEAVYLATPLPDQTSGMSGRDVWTWRWSDGVPPEDARDIADVILDVSSGVWVIHSPRGVQLLDSTGQLMVATDHPGDRQFFGHMLSPDGRFWRSWGDEVTETATGELWVVPGPGPQVARLAWSDVDEQVVLVDGRLRLCTYPAGACSEPVDFPDRDGAQLDMPTS